MSCRKCISLLSARDVLGRANDRGIAGSPMAKCEAGRMLRESFVVAGQEVRWDRWGAGPPVVFCHGTPWSSALWARIADAVSADHTVYLWDMLGYGASTMADGQDVSLGRQAALLNDLLGYWELTDPHVVAH